MVATGLAGGRAGDLIVEDLTAGGIVHQFVRIADESRSSTIVLDPAGTQVATEIVEYGPVVRPDELEAFAAAYGYLLGGSDAVVLAGSLPRDVPEDWYATALREARRQRVYAVLDSEGEPLRLGLGGEPDLIVPNQMEAEELVGFEFETVQDLVVALEQIVEMGARSVIITRDDGALALRPRGGPAALPARHGAPARGGVPGRRRRRAAGRLPGRAPRRAPVCRRAPSRRRLREREHPARAAGNARSARGAAAFSPGRSGRAHTCPSLTKPGGRPREPLADPVASIG